MSVCGDEMGHRWAPFEATDDYRITEVCVRSVRCDATVTRDMTDDERHVFDQFRHAEQEGGADY